MNSEKMVYNESLGHGSAVYYTNMVIPHESIQIFKYSYGNLIHSRLFSVGDICHYINPVHHLRHLTDKQLNESQEIIKHCSRINDPSSLYTRITDITGNWVYMKYTKLPINEEFRVICNEFAWRNWDFVEAPPHIPT